ncbi:MAG TPA: amidase family protein, partial [Xanthobacteraceae bacterium]|nr:amidase family protein [Xanthobacteraceae bacterium]
SAASVAVGMVSAALGTQVIGSTIRPASYCGVIGFKPTVGALNRGGSHDYFSQSCTGVLATTLEDTWQVAYEIASRAGGDPGFPGLFGPDRPPAPEKPRRIAFLETAGWAVASDTAKQAFETALSRLSAAGIAILDRRSDPKIAALETAIANARMLSARINEWEARWPLNTYRERDEEKLSVAMRERLKRAEAMRLDDYRALLKERNSARACYADLAAVCDGCVTLSAPGPAPVGLDATGNPAFAVPASLLGIPAVSLPVLQDEGLPLGLQILGFEHRDDAMFSLARWVTSCVRA